MNWSENNLPNIIEIDDVWQTTDEERTPFAKVQSILKYGIDVTDSWNKSNLYNTDPLSVFTKKDPSGFYGQVGYIHKVEDFRNRVAEFHRWAERYFDGWKKYVGDKNEALWAAVDEANKLRLQDIQLLADYNIGSVVAKYYGDPDKELPCHILGQYCLYVQNPEKDEFVLCHYSTGKTFLNSPVYGEKKGLRALYTTWRLIDIDVILKRADEVGGTEFLYLPNQIRWEIQDLWKELWLSYFNGRGTPKPSLRKKGD